MTAEMSLDANRESRSAGNRHGQHCFVLMPYGRTTEEVRWFQGWYEVVIRPAMAGSGYESVLAAAEEQPGAINDEIRAHLAFDPMVIVDLGGMRPDDPPNPNVMYELGIRHAFGLPVVMMAWETQKLPFDVGNQRAVMTGRHLLDLEPTRQRLTTFIRSAAEGRYYNPMEAVGREATIEAASASLGEDSLLGALVNEVRELRGSILRRRHAFVFPPSRARFVRSFVPKKLRKELWLFAMELGLDTATWGKLLSRPVPEAIVEEARSWDMEDWKKYLSDRAHELANETQDKIAVLSQLPPAGRITQEIIEAVAAELPAQPWPTGTHKKIAAKLSLSHQQVGRVIDELIRQGRCFPQIDGRVYEPRREEPGNPDPTDANGGS